MAIACELEHHHDDKSEDAEKDNIGCSLNPRDCKRCCTTWNIYYKTLVLFVIIFFYQIIGGGIFVALESPNEIEAIQTTRENLIMLRRTQAQIIGNLTANSDLNRTEAAVLVYAIGNLSVAASQAVVSRNWEFGPAVFFTSTVITTIGYGSIAPSTFGGRLFFIFYALAGIPVALVFLATLGDLLNKLLEAAIKPLGERAKKPMVKILVTLSSTIIGLLLFIFIPAIIFDAIEESWSYFESVYFCFVSLTTVGFGDFVPSLASETIQNNGLNGLYRICSAFWIWFGLAFVSLLIARLQSTFEDMGKALQMRAKRKRLAKAKLNKEKELAEVAIEADKGDQEPEVTKEVNNGKQNPESEAQTTSNEKPQQEEQEKPSVEEQGAAKDEADD